MPASELTLPGEARSAAMARRFLSTTLTGWGETPYGDDAALLVSELVTNAALHAKTEIVVRIELMADGLRIAVTDGSPRQPVVRHYSDQSTTGRGLGMVSAIASQWGIRAHPDGSKTVWAELGAARDRAASPEHGAPPDLKAFPDLEEPAAGGACGASGPSDTIGFLWAS